MALHILKSQANEVFELVTKVGLEPSQFAWTEVAEGSYSGRPASRLAYKGADFYFEFDNNSKSFNSQFSPGVQKITESQTTSTWLDQLALVKGWLLNLRKEIESPDLWRAISKEAQVLESAASSDTSNEPFTVGERAYIVEGINEIKQFLLTAHKLDPEIVESRLNYLIESSERVGRKDWINLLLSVLIGIVINAALPPETTRELFRFVGTVLRQILNQPPLLP